MNKKFIYGAIIVTFIVAVLALWVSLVPSKSDTGLGATITTNLPSLGLNNIAIGTGCDQQYTSCVPGNPGITTIDSTGLVENGIGYTFPRITSLNQASTTLCAIPSPAATSTLEAVVVNITSGTTTASTIVIASSTTAFATTSKIVSQTVGAGAQATVDWHGGSLNSVISPNTFVVISQQGNIGTFSDTGTCSATFRTAN